jgi:hypothetical protein
MRSAEVIYGSARRIDLKAAKQHIAAGAQVTSRTIRVDEDLLQGVAEKHRDLFIGVCGVIEKFLGSEIPASKRRALLEKLAELFSAQ